MSTTASRRPRIFLVRHGETEWNAVDRLLSLTDMPLNERGEAQARRLGAELAADGIRFDRAVASPLVRAHRTAELILAGLPDPPELEVDERLVEVDFGPLEGWTAPQIEADPAARAWRAGADHPGVETNAHTIDRATAVWAGLPVTGTTLVVGHGRFLRFLICACVLGMTRDAPQRMRMRNCRPAIVEPGPRPLLIALNAAAPYGPL